VEPHLLVFRVQLISGGQVTPTNKNSFCPSLSKITEVKTLSSELAKLLCFHDFENPCYFSLEFSATLVYLSLKTH
jgi:hypothetical protein